MSDVVRFGPFELRPAQHRLLRDGVPVAIGGRAFELLCTLVAHRHRVLGKDELLDLCWPHQAVESNNLAVQVWTLRQVLGAQAITTVPGRGYRFTADTADAPPPAAAPLHPAGELFGRQDDLQRLLAALETHRLVTVLGPAGVGKSRLAQTAMAATAPGWRDGVVAVDLAAVQDDAGADASVRQALAIVSPQTDAAALPWVAAMGHRQLLLVLDNCEHVRAGLAALLQPLLAQTTAARVLATSQVPLNLADEHTLRLAPLPLPDEHDTVEHLQANAAVQLLRARVAGLDPQRAFDDKAWRDAGALCRQLDGLPLAIELAAVRVPVLGLAGVRERLADRLRLLAAAPARAGARHATLAEALDWSHALLDAAEQRLLHRLAVFCGGFGFDLAQAMGDDPDDEWAVLDRLGSLVDKSLVVAVPGHDPPRLRLLDSTRAYALRQLDSAGEVEACRARHAQALLAGIGRSFEARKQGRATMDQTVGQLRLELDNLRAAIAWATSAPGQAGTAIALVAAAWPATLYLGLHAECLQWMLALEDRLDDADVPAPLAGFFRVGLGKVGLRGAVSPRHRMAALQRAEATFLALGDKEYLLGTRQAMAQIACQGGEPEAAYGWMADSLARAGPDDPAAYRADLLIWQAMACALQGREVEARALRDRALPLCRAEGNEEFMAVLLTDLAELQLLLGDAGPALPTLQALVHAARERRLHSHVLGPLLAHLYAAHLALGQLGEAQALAMEVWQHMTLLGGAREGCHFHGWLAALQGRWAAAAQLLGAGDAFVREVGEARLLAEPQARAAALELLAAKLPQDPIAQWMTAGSTMGDAELATLLAG